MPYSVHSLAAPVATSIVVIIVAVLFPFCLPVLSGVAVNSA